jgi:hypothetical protein
LTIEARSDYKNQNPLQTIKFFKIPAAVLHGESKSIGHWSQAALSRAWALAAFSVVLGCACHRTSAQGALTNGYSYQGLIAPSGHVDSWTFTAAPGNTIVARVGAITATNGFLVRIQLFSPSSVLIASSSSLVAAEVEVLVTNTGTYTVAISDGSVGGIGTGSYRLKLIKPGGAIVVAPGDEGGTMINGGMHTGIVDLGDMDAWSFPAAAGDSVVVRMGEMVTNSTLSPYLRLYGPGGGQLAASSSAAATEVSFRATNSGTFTFIAADGSSGFAGSGNYRLNLGKTGSAIVISPADEGGLMTGVESYAGNIDVGDLDVWAFNACAGDPIQLQMSELTIGSTLSPWLRLYGRDGVLLDTVTGSSFAQINRLAPASGTYVIVAADGSTGLSGSGAYTLSANGLSSGLKLCMPIISGTNFNFRGIGGTPNATSVLYQTTNVATPVALLSPVLTNQFDSFGVFSVTNSFNPAIHQQYFRLAEPQ